MKTWWYFGGKNSDELIGNLQSYELRRNSQQQEETKKDRGIALKIMEEDSS